MQYLSLNSISEVYKIIYGFLYVLRNFHFSGSTSTYATVSFYQISCLVYGTSELCTIFVGK